jgi:16S rRNA (cytosine967-C5)-methyltransferase
MNSNDERIALWRQLQSTAAVVQSVRGGMSGTLAIDAAPLDLRGAVQALAFHVWRNLGRAQALRSLLAPRTPPPAVDALLCVALALVWNQERAPYDAFTLVNQTVEAAKKNAATKAQASFVNACLRRFLRERADLVAHTDGDPVAYWNHPQWWIDQLRREQPHGWQHILTASNLQAPMTLRVNARQTTRDAYLQELADAGVAATPNGASGVTLGDALAVQRIPGFAAGRVSVQDAAAQMAAPLLLAGLPFARSGRVLDACAAPGGKTGHLLELFNGEVMALEVDTKRAAKIAQNTQRLGLVAKVLTADALNPQSWWDGQPFDAILLDAPCTASGIVRRHPDVRWLRRETDVSQLAAVQGKMMKTLWGLLKPGGKMVYCTCSLFNAEGQGQVQTFLARHSDAVLLPSPGHLMPRNGASSEVLPDNQASDHDGFFYALLEKKMA